MQHVKFESNSNDNIPPRTREPFYCEAANLNFATGDDDCIDYAYRKTPVRVSRQDPLSHRIIEKRRRDRMNNCLADLSRLIPAEYLKKGRGRVEKTEIIEMAIKHMKYLQYMNHYRLGYQECMSEAMRFLVEVEGRFPREPICVRLLGHLQTHCDNICRGTADAPPTGVTSTGQIHVNIDKMEPKVEPNNNYDSEHQQESMNATNGFEMVAEVEGRSDMDTEADVDVGVEKRGEQHHEHHAGYKYKNDIKQRFTQDNAKNPKDRRNSTPISTDNQTCSSIGSPTPAHFIDSTPSSHAILKPSSHHHEMEPMMTTSWTLSTAPPPSQNLSLFSTNETSAFSSPLHRKPTSLLEVKNLTNGVNGTHSHSSTNGMTNGHSNTEKLGLQVPAFVLHTKGSFYIPVTLEYDALSPYLNGHDLLSAMNQDVVLHPVAINVNFQQQPYVALQQPKKFEKLPG